MLETKFVVSEAQRADTRPLSAPTLFRSFWMGGFEAATHINSAGQRLDMIAGVQHDTEADRDYGLLRSFGMKTARDAVRWHLIDRSGSYDFSSFGPMLQAAIENRVQVIWDLCHYGWPDDLDLFSTAFVERFARFCAATARFVREHTDEIPFYAPVNEISFLAWGASRDFMFPYALGRDEEIKFQLVRAAIAGCEAIWSVDSRARFVYPEPTVHVVPPRLKPQFAALAQQHRQSQFEAWDLIAGRAAPELGGHPKYLDILGSNFYHSNQWEVEGEGRLRWEDEPRDDRWLPYHRLLAEIYARYRRPLFIAETSHVGSGRARWIREIGHEVFLARRSGVPLEGVCLYPILDRYDWQDANHWHNSGLWDLHLDSRGRYERVLNVEYATELRAVQEMLATIGCI